MPWWFHYVIKCHCLRWSMHQFPNRVDFFYCTIILSCLLLLYNHFELTSSTVQSFWVDFFYCTVFLSWFLLLYNHIVRYYNSYSIYTSPQVIVYLYNHRLHGILKNVHWQFSSVIYFYIRGTVYQERLPRRHYSTKTLSYRYFVVFNFMSV